MELEMKYSRMLCWVSRDEIKCLKKENENYKISIVFAKNYDDFVTLIKDDDYLVFSIKKANKYFPKLELLLTTFSNIFFHAIRRLDNKGTSCQEIAILEKSNVIHLPYDDNELFLEFIGEIDSLYEKRNTCLSSRA
jgi:hypothetical protein